MAKKKEKKETTKKDTKTKTSTKKGKGSAKKPVAKKTTSKKKKGKALVLKDKNDKSIKTDDDVDEDAMKRGDRPMSVVGHLHELRSRLIVVLLTIIIVMLVSFFLSEYILNIFIMPYLKTGLKLNLFTLIEGIMLRLKASLLTAILIGLPVIFYEIWKYIVPAIEKKDRKFIRLSIIAAVFLMYGGVLFSYFLVLPIAIKMLLKFAPSDMNTVIGASQYLNFVLLFSLAMGIIFELPIIVMILTKMNILKPSLLISKRKYAIVLIWIFAAVITPGPDVLSQALIAIPVMLLYEISIIISKLVIRRKIKREQQGNY